MATTIHQHAIVINNFHEHFHQQTVRELRDATSSNTALMNTLNYNEGHCSVNFLCYLNNACCSIT